METLSFSQEEPRPARPSKKLETQIFTFHSPIVIPERLASEHRSADHVKVTAMPADPLPAMGQKTSKKLAAGPNWDAMDARRQKSVTVFSADRPAPPLSRKRTSGQALDRDENTQLIIENYRKRPKPAQERTLKSEKDLPQKPLGPGRRRSARRNKRLPKRFENFELNYVSSDEGNGYW